MIVKRTGKQTYKKCLVVLICLLVAGNSAHGTVVCLGSDGHIEIEPAFHEQCDDHAHSEAAEKRELSHHADHAEGRHCEPCVDIPISILLEKITRSAREFNFASPAPMANVLPVGNDLNPFAYKSASSAFDVTSYFAPLRTVILLN